MRTPAPTPVPAARARRPQRKRPGAFHHGDLREAAIALAMDTVERDGHAGLSMNRLASRLGVTGPALYAHFADRRALLLEVGARGFARFEAALSDAYEHAPDHWSGAAALARAYILAANANPGWFRLQFASDLEERPAVDLKRTPARYQPDLSAGFQRAFGKQNVRHATISLWAVAHGLAMLIIERTLSLDDPDIDRALALHIDGMRRAAG